jgi:hypothetical protein
MNEPQHSDSLSRTLREWRVTPARNPQFRAEVRARIEAARAVDSWSGYLRGHVVTVAGALALALVLGAVGGRNQARALAAADSARLASAYVQSLDARAMTTP